MKRIALLVWWSLALAAQPDRFGNPACEGAGEELADRKYFVLCHSGTKKVPVWVGYELKREHLRRVAARSFCRTRFRKGRVRMRGGSTGGGERCGLYVHGRGIRELRVDPKGQRMAFTAGSNARGEVWVMENLLGRR